MAVFLCVDNAEANLRRVSFLSRCDILVTLREQSTAASSDHSCAKMYLLARARYALAANVGLSVRRPSRRHIEN